MEVLYCVPLQLCGCFARLIHPVMPFVTEELWQRLPKASGGQPESIMLAPYPSPQQAWRSLALEQELDFQLEIVKAVRSLRAGQSLMPAVPDAAASKLFCWINLLPVLRPIDSIIRLLDKIASWVYYQSAKWRVGLYGQALKKSALAGSDGQENGTRFDGRSCLLQIRA